MFIQNIEQKWINERRIDIFNIVQIDFFGSRNEKQHIAAQIVDTAGAVGLLAPQAVCARGRHSMGAVGAIALALFGGIWIFL